MKILYTLILFFVFTGIANAEEPQRDWRHKYSSFSTPHPYPDNMNIEFVIEEPGATKLSLYFSKIELENGYDNILIFDREGELIQKISGSFEDVYSKIIESDKVRIQITSDNSEYYYGVDLFGYAYQK